VAVRDNNTKNTKNITGVGIMVKSRCMLAFLIINWMIKCNRANVASEKIFAKVRGRLYNANMCLTLSTGGGSRRHGLSLPAVLSLSEGATAHGVVIN